MRTLRAIFSFRVSHQAKRCDLRKILASLLSNSKQDQRQSRTKYQRQEGKQNNQSFPKKPEGQTCPSQYAQQIRGGGIPGCLSQRWHHPEAQIGLGKRPSKSIPIFARQSFTKLHYNDPIPKLRL